MKLSVPYLIVDIRTDLSVEKTAEMISEALIPGSRWHQDKSGHYEEVSVLALSQVYFGMQIYLIEQESGHFYTLESHFQRSTGDFENVELVRYDISDIVVRLLSKTAGLATSIRNG